MGYNELVEKPEMSSEKRLHVGLAIRRRRRDLNMSQTTLANEMGVSQEVISNYEIGQTPVRADDLPRFAEILDVPVTYFFVPSIPVEAVLEAIRNRPDYTDYSGKGAAKDFLELEPEAQQNVMEMYRMMMAQFFSPKP